MRSGSGWCNKKHHMNAPQCPSCKAPLAKMPQRKTKCKACGAFIFIKSTPDNRERRLMTQAQADAAEQAWSDHYASKLDASRAQFMQPALSGDRDAVLEMMRCARNPEEREHWHLLLIEMDLAKLARQGIRSVQLFGDRLCPTCEPLNKTIISTSSSARAVIPESCTCDPKGRLIPSGWIKRPDGSGYVDQG